MQLENTQSYIFIKCLILTLDIWPHHKTFMWSVIYVKLYG